MPEIAYEEDPLYNPAPAEKISLGTRLARLVMKMGLASNEESATKVLLGITVVAAILAVVIFLYSGPAKIPYVPIDVTKGVVPRQ